MTMTTVTLNILDDKAINLLKDLEAMNIIRIQKNDGEYKLTAVDFAAKYSGSMSKQTPEEIDRQLNELRNEWD